MIRGWVGRFAAAALLLAVVLHHQALSARDSGLHILWFCYLSCVTLALGVGLPSPRLARASALGVMAGTLAWVVEVLTFGTGSTATALHLGGSLVGVLALRELRGDPRAWRDALVGLLGLQLLSRLALPPGQNVNLAHAPHPAVAGWFGSYPVFWLASTLTFALVLYGLGALALRVFPPGRPPETMG